MTPHLFVYGTLMATASAALGRDMRVRLQSEARFVGAGSIQGRLYDLGRYPALTLSDDAADVVHGEVYAIHDPAVTLPWLDEYEGIGRGPHVVDEYERVEHQVRLASGADMIAWVYLFRRNVTGLRWVKSGRWQVAS